MFNEEEKENIFKDCHSESHGGHMSIYETRARISERFYWRKMSLWKTKFQHATNVKGLKK